MQIGLWLYNVWRCIRYLSIVKILTRDNPHLNLRQFVTDFNTRWLSKAWEFVRSNLKSAQSKMKLYFDENAQNRSVETGDRAIALLSIPDMPLQTRYLWSIYC